MGKVHPEPDAADTVHITSSPQNQIATLSGTIESNYPPVHIGGEILPMSCRFLLVLVANRSCLSKSIPSITLNLVVSLGLARSLIAYGRLARNALLVRGRYGRRELI